jgi:tetratricopeptide (TPR) repeat protein
MTRSLWSRLRAPALLLALALPASGQEAWPEAWVERARGCLGEDSAQSIEYFSRAWDAKHEEGVALVTYGLAGSLRDKGCVAEAAELLRRVLERFPHPVQEPVFLAFLGDLERYRGRFDEAFSLFERAEAAASDPTNALHALARAYVEGYRAEALLKLGLVELAAEASKRQANMSQEYAALLLPDEPDPVLDLARAQVAHAVDLRAGLYGLAEERMRGVLDLVREAGPQRAQVELSLAQALIHRARNVAAGLERGSVGSLLGEAEELFQGAIAGAPPDSETVFQARVGLVDLYWQRGEAESERAALEACYTTDGDFELDWLADRAAFRARRLLADGAPREDLEAVAAELESVFDEVERQWLAVNRPPGGLGFLHWDEQRLLLAAWIDVVLALEPDEEAAAEHALAILARAQAIGTLTRRLASNLGGQSGEAWTEFRASLRDGAGALVFLPSMDDSHVFAVDAGRVRHARLAASQRDLSRAAAPVTRHARQLPGAKPAVDAAQEAKTLARLLLPDDVRRSLAEWRSVTFVGNELIGDPPLEVLPLEDGESLGLLMATSYLPSLELGGLLARRQGTDFDPASAVALLAAGDSVQRDAELTRAERERLAEVFGRRNVLEGTDARLDRPLGGGLLAVVAHGEYLASERRPAHLVLSGGLAGAEELERAPLPPLVCLVACGAARGPVRRGDDGAVHLGGAALLGGAATVLLAPNEVETAASLALLTTFVEGLREGHPPDEALRRARVALAERDPRWGHPFYSSSMRLFGLGRLPRD